MQAVSLQSMRMVEELSMQLDSTRLGRTSCVIYLAFKCVCMCICVCMYRAQYDKLLASAGSGSTHTSSSSSFFHNSNHSTADMNDIKLLVYICMCVCVYVCMYVCIDCSQD